MVEPFPSGHRPLFNCSSLHAVPASSPCHAAGLPKNNRTRAPSAAPRCVCSVALLSSLGTMGEGRLVSQLLFGFHRPKCLLSGWGVRFGARHSGSLRAILGYGEPPMCVCTWNKHSVSTYSDSVQVSSDLSKGCVCSWWRELHAQEVRDSCKIPFPSGNGTFMDIPTLATSRDESEYLANCRNNSRVSRFPKFSGWLSSPDFL